MVDKFAVRLELAHRRRIAAQHREPHAKVFGHASAGDGDETQRVDLLEETSEQMVEAADSIQEACAARPIELDVDDVTLGGGDHHARHQPFALERPAVRRDDLHARAGEGKVEDPRVRRVGQKEAHDLTRLRRQSIA